MTYAIESMGQLILSISLYGFGIALGLIGLILGIARGMTKNENHWGLIFSVFAWTISLVIPNVWFSSIIFGMGAIGITFAMMPLVKEINDKNIIILAIIVIMLNIILVFASGAYTASFTWHENMEEGYTTIETTINSVTGEMNLITPETGLCRTGEEDEDGQCENEIMQGTYTPEAFAPFATIIAIGTYVGKAIAFIGVVTIAPILISTQISNLFTNNYISILTTIMILIWEIAIFYKLILFVLNKYGT